MQNLYQKILKESEVVDDRFRKISVDELGALSIPFVVPPFHPRHDAISQYSLTVGEIRDDVFTKGQFVVADRWVKESFLAPMVGGPDGIFEKAREDTFKEWKYLNSILDQRNVQRNTIAGVVGIGGGLTLNVAAYVAEKLEASLTQILTTVIGMADGSGGKVRLNMIDQGRFMKHYYKSFYEPDRILVDARFLATLSHLHIAIGLCEIVKHGLFQSSTFMEYLLSPEFDPFNDKDSLLKAILWAASLKAVCLRIDVEENANGSRGILRGGHEISDRIEEESHFTVPHGFAVSIGLYRELTSQTNALLPQFESFCGRFSIPRTIEEYQRTQ